MDAMCRKGQTIDLLTSEVERLEKENKELKRQLNIKQSLIDTINKNIRDLIASLK